MFFQQRDSQSKKSMIKIEFIQDFKSCYKKGDMRTVHLHFAKVLIDGGFAKAVGVPQEDKMVQEPIMEK